MFCALQLLNHILLQFAAYRSTACLSLQTCRSPPAASTIPEPLNSAQLRRRQFQLPELASWSPARENHVAYVVQFTPPDSAVLGFVSTNSCCSSAARPRQPPQSLSGPAASRACDPYTALQLKDNNTCEQTAHCVASVQQADTLKDAMALLEQQNLSQKEAAAAVDALLARFMPEAFAAVQAAEAQTSMAAAPLGCRKLLRDDVFHG